ncbi:hypothetical protein F2Q70_00005198 [Brassica cretica]|uniref:Replication factor A C-terminal domain-containing protein n=1 Tax=Brassica cretica TaxID=69181 RepID=A0A8S9ILU7_BRACR|nr:hypothetical protein F2Q70_00005198 [Brassica cretica]
MAMKRNGKSPVSSDSDEKVVFSNDVSLGPHASQLRFRIIHFWEARNPVKKTLIGMEMLLIEEHGTVVQRFIPLGRIMKYLPDMIRGSVYKLINFYGSKNKPVYRVADHVATVSFTWNSKLTVLHDIPIQFNEDHFRFHSYEDFEANCDLRGDLYAVVGHMKLVNKQTLTERPILDELEIATTRHVLVHVQSHELGCNPETAKQVSAEVVTKRETLSIADIFSYIKHDSVKDAFFECTATIDDVVHGSTWYYIACSGCHSKATKGPTSMVCTNTKCEKVNTTGSVYKLNNFYGSKNKPVYRVADHIATVSFTWNSEMTVLHDIPIHFDEDRFRFHSYEDFEANCDLRADLGPVMKLYLWDQAATEFCKKFITFGNTPTVLLLTTVNPKCLGG